MMCVCGTESTERCSYWQSPLLKPLDGRVVHGVTRRGGGVSLKPFSSLNLGLHVGDQEERVLRNREIALSSLGLSPANTVCAEQVHGVRVLDVGREEAGAGAYRYERALKGVDALITCASGIALLGYFADCIPIIIADVRGRWVGMAHAGWKGSLGRISQNVITALDERGVPPSELYVALGPGIRVCCYEVSEDLAEQFRRVFGPKALRWDETGRPFLDLVAINVQTLLDAGVPEHHIDVSGDCTACRTDLYFSHRIEGPRTGRMAAIVARVP